MKAILFVVSRFHAVMRLSDHSSLPFWTWFIENPRPL